MRSGLLAFSTLFISSISFATIESAIQTQFYQYASDTSPTFYLSEKTIFETRNFLTEFHAYDESGPKGAWSVDLDPLRYNLKLDGAGNDYVWLGREHPLNLTRSQQVEPFTAVGSIWVQNQLDALNPRVSGWVGLGLIKTITPGWKVNFAYSPLFLPTFGPSLGFTNQGDLNPSRFARLPPSQVETGGVTVPIRYQLQVGQLSQLLLQHQVFLAVANNTSAIDAEIFAYTAPVPNPVPLANANLAVGADTVNAQVQIQPQFPREYWSGARIQFKELLFQPALELAQNLKTTNYRIISLTNYFDLPQLNPFVIKKPAKAAFGFLTHIGETFTDPQYSDCLAFIRLPFELTNEMTFRTMLQATLLNMRQGFFWSNELEYSFSTSFSILAAINILSGQDNSYFGDWRQEDSYAMGVKYKW